MSHGLAQWSWDCTSGPSESRVTILCDFISLPFSTGSDNGPHSSCFTRLIQMGTEITSFLLGGSSGTPMNYRLLSSISALPAWAKEPLTSHYFPPQILFSGWPSLFSKQQLTFLILVPALLPSLWNAADLWPLKYWQFFHPVQKAPPRRLLYCVVPSDHDLFRLWRFRELTPSHTRWRWLHSAFPSYLRFSMERLQLQLYFFFFFYLL